MKRIIVLMAVLAASFTAILVAPAVASAGCTPTINSSAPVYAFNNLPDGSLTRSYQKPDSTSVVACTSTNNQVYKVWVDFQKYNGSSWVWYNEYGDPSNQSTSIWHFANLFVNATYKLTCFDNASTGSKPLYRNPCPAGNSYPNHYVWTPCVAEAGYTLVRAALVIKNMSTGSKAYSYSSSTSARPTCGAS